MKRFKFRFKRLQELRERREEAALLKLALAQTDLAREEELLAELVGAVADSGYQLGALLADGATAAQLRNADDYRTARRTSARQQRRAVQEAARRAAERADEFHRAHREADAIRKLHERKRRQHRKESLRELQKELDEIGGSRLKAQETQFGHEPATGSVP